MRQNDREVVVSIPVSNLKFQATVLGGLVVLMWLLEILDWLLPWWHPDAWGIIPRRVIGLRGILFAPLLHGSFSHVAANSIPFIVLGWLVMLRRTHEFFVVTAVVAFIAGLGTWLFGSSNSIHIGASGIIFGYFGFLVLLGYFERSIGSILRAVIVGAVYGGLIWGVLPLQAGISWESHLFGFLGGALAAYLLAQREELVDQIKILQ